MHPTHRPTLALAAVALTAASLATATAPLPARSAAQGTTPTACSLVDAAELMRITGRQDVLKQGPVPSEPGDTPKGTTECEFLGFSFSLTEGMTHQWFERSRADQRKTIRTDPAAGVGEEGYYWWDPRPGTYRQVGIALRKGTSRLVVMDLASSDSIEALKPVLLSVAKSAAAKMR